MFTVTRSEHNPILSPDEAHPWEAAAAFNGCPVMVGKKTYLVYRALSEPQLLKEPHIRMSVVGRAISSDGEHYGERMALVKPSTDFDRYGCEDPRVTKIGKSYYILYTALGGFPFSADNIKVAVAITDDMETIREKHLVTPFNAKGMAFFPEKVNGKFAAVLTVNTDRPPSEICYAEADRMEDFWSPEYWNEWMKSLDSHKISIRRLPSDQLELGAVPVKTDKGWILVYSHIQRYGHSDQVFGVEAVLLDPKNPRTVIGRTKGPFMAPEAYYEQTGLVPHITFPTGALIKKGSKAKGAKDKGCDKLEIYYGAADTFCAMATVPLDNLLRSLTGVEEKKISRFPGNPIISPRPGFFWEQGGTINPAAIDLGGKVHILYRAVSDKNVSTLGYASSHDGLSIDERSDKPVYLPRMPFEMKSGSDRDYGCEDPRLMLVDGRVCMMYTAYDGVTPRVAFTSISQKDFLAKRWSAWSEPHVITPSGVANKDAAILPETVNGKYMIFHRVHESICADFVSSLDFTNEVVDECIEILDPRRGMWDGGKVGISAPPVKTKNGWLLLYHGVSWSTTYRVGAVLLDLKDPTIVIARTAIPLFEPEEEYERKGLVPNVVFPCGLVVRGSMAYIYYGGGDSVIGVATVKVATILKMLEA